MESSFYEKTKEINKKQQIYIYIYIYLIYIEHI